MKFGVNLKINLYHPYNSEYIPMTNYPHVVSYFPSGEFTGLENKGVGVELSPLVIARNNLLRN